MRFLPDLLAGITFGFVLIKSEAASWYRIMEMFHFQAFHMFGIMASAIATAFAGVQLLKRLDRVLTLDGALIAVPDKAPGRYNYILGGTIFGLGWGVIGLCPGPVFALVGIGSIGALAGALLGAWLYGLAKHQRPY